MQVLEDQQNRQPDRARPDVTHQSLECLRVPLLRREVRRRALLGRRQTQERGEERDELGSGLYVALEEGFELHKLLERIVAREKACGILHLGDYRM